MNTTFVGDIAHRALTHLKRLEAESIQIMREAVAEARDVKGLYKKARSGELPHFTGADSPYEPPEQPDLRVDTTTMTADEAADQVIAVLRERGMIERSLPIDQVRR